MKLNESDYRLISYLYHHNRESLSKIAKAVKLSREQVDYKLKKYLNEGLIKKFATIFDYSKLGYDYYILILLKFQKPCLIENFEKSLLTNKNNVSHGAVYGKYDIYANFIFKTEKEISDYLAELFSEDLISDYLLVKPYFAELYPLKWIKNKEFEKYSLISYSKPIKLDEKDKIILKELEKNSRTRLLDIAIKANISPELAIYKLKKLQKNKVIIGSRIQFDMSKLGYYFSDLLITFKNFSKITQEKIKKFAKSSSHINSMSFNLIKPNCFLQLFHKQQSELYETINKLKDAFKNEQFDLEIISLHEEELVNTLPFL